MDSASPQFVAFGLLVALISNFNQSRPWRDGVLLSANLVFIVLLVKNASPWSLAPFAAFLMLGYAAVKTVERTASATLSGAIVGTVIVYIWLKKYTFLPDQTFLHFPYFILGLSYIFFRVLSLLVLSANRSRQTRIDPLSYLVYLLNFTTFLSGPIQSYEDFSRDRPASDALALTPGVIGLQLERIVRGFFKVNVLALLLNAVLQDALTDLTQTLPPTLKLFCAFRLIIVYPVFLYMNFSGYIDIVIAIARLLRMRLPENFNRPFFAASFLEFWNRWHITLSLWLKTYVYNPLLITLMRRLPSAGLEPLLGVFCFFVTFFLVGIWHGRTSEFVVFGVLQGGGVALNKLWQLGMARLAGRKTYKQIGQNAFYIACARGLTFTWFAFTLLWFWANWQQLGMISKALSGTQWCAVWLAIWVSATATLAFWEWLRAALLTIKFDGAPILTGRYAMVVYGSIMGFISYLVTVVLAQPAPDVVYKAF
jgi:D-alanyl-lipoteichoic acid acyltransferase DltB (MBOAT superfamily)